VELIARHLRKAFGRVTALTDVSLKAGPGLLVLLGPNGSGKSTLLRLLATVIAADAGEIALDGYPYAGDLRPLRRRLGYLPQRLRWPGHMTPRRCLQYAAQLKGAAGGDALLEALGLAALAEQPMAHLSSGQQRRVGIAQALLGSPRLLILDEPIAGLDPEERGWVLDLLSQDAPQRIVVLSTHVPSEAEAISQRVLLLRQGAVSYAGETAALRRHAGGHVWEVTVPTAAVQRYLEQHLISRVATRGAESVLRVVGPPPPGLPARPVDGTLEDAYLFLQRSPERLTPTAANGTLWDKYQPGSG